MNMDGVSHWKSTVLGVFTILVAVSTAAVALLDSNAATNVDLAQTQISVLAGLTLIRAQFPPKQ